MTRNRLTVSKLEFEAEPHKQGDFVCMLCASRRHALQPVGSAAIIWVGRAAKPLGSDSITSEKMPLIP